MPGMVLFNCFINAMGFILMYKILPETENRTLEDIEMHFAGIILTRSFDEYSSTFKSIKLSFVQCLFLQIIRKN